jgi:hypothetical protein
VAKDSRKPRVASLIMTLRRTQLQKQGTYKVTEDGRSGKIDSDESIGCIITNEANKSPEPEPLVRTIRGFSGPIAPAYRYVYVTNYGAGRSIDTNLTDKVSAIVVRLTK